MSSSRRCRLRLPPTGGPSFIGCRRNLTAAVGATHQSRRPGRPSDTDGSLGLAYRARRVGERNGRRSNDDVAGAPDRDPRPLSPHSGEHADQHDGNSRCGHLHKAITVSAGGFLTERFELFRQTRVTAWVPATRPSAYPQPVERSHTDGRPRSGRDTGGPTPRARQNGTTSDRSAAPSSHRRDPMLWRCSR